MTLAFKQALDLYLSDSVAKLARILKQAVRSRLRTDVPGQMKQEIVVKPHLFAFAQIAVSVGYAPAIRDITSLHVQSVSVIVAGVQTNADADSI